ncbi:MAG TPA: AAA family ATPase [Candidatus Acidoferrales bacterium]|nr:AAA family ATPase [Candidatus Acidoferrales bacterium]
MQPSLAFPQSLAEKYRPRRMVDFIGLDKQRKILAKLAAQPFASAWLFVGPSGTGKTSLALALADEIHAELIHIPSQHCTVAELEESLRMTQYVPMAGKTFWLVLVDEADAMSDKAQLALLSKLDATGMRDNCIFIFTCNATDRLEARFLSRCRVLEFSTYGLNGNLVSLLRRVWKAESNGATEPNLERLSRDAKNNVRESLMRLELELMSAEPGEVRE